MTVLGKGGRPRKWRSDADRVRAYRARQRGEDEPATFEAALVDGDELARVVERGRQLQDELFAALGSLAELEAELQAERRRHQASRRKLDRATANLDERIARVEQLTTEQHSLRDEVAALKVENAALRACLTVKPAPTPGPNRAARRQAAKRERRSEG